MSSRVFIDAPEMENDTLEDFYFLCKSKQAFPCFEFQSLKEARRNIKERERAKQISHFWHKAIEHPLFPDWFMHQLVFIMI